MKSVSSISNTLQFRVFQHQYTVQRLQPVYQQQSWRWPRGSQRLWPQCKPGESKIDEYFDDNDGGGADGGDIDNDGADYDNYLQIIMMVLIIIIIQAHCHRDCDQHSKKHPKGRGPTRGAAVLFNYKWSSWRGPYLLSCFENRYKQLGI